jgi:hypothetical protein
LERDGRRNRHPLAAVTLQAPGAVILAQGGMARRPQFASIRKSFAAPRAGDVLPAPRDLLKIETIARVRPVTP